MTSAVPRVLAALLLAGCSLDSTDVTGKGCPCVAGFTCKVTSRECIIAENVPEPSLGCVIYTDGKLYCSNAAAPMHASPSAASEVVNNLRTTYSWFDCWGTGERHAGGNNTWYYTVGDDSDSRGWIPGVAVNTPDMFDEDPTAVGFAACNP
jgi:hypothetical protein